MGVDAYEASVCCCDVRKQLPLVDFLWSTDIAFMKPPSRVVARNALVLAVEIVKAVVRATGWVGL